jgi:hypothetical protein
LSVAYRQINFLCYLNGALERSERHTHYVWEILKEMHYSEDVGMEGVAIALNMHEVNVKT